MQLNVAPQFKYQKVKLSLSESLAFSYLDTEKKIHLLTHYHPARKLREGNYRPQQYLHKGNVFTSVCQEFCPHGGGRCTPPPGRHPVGQTPPRQTPPSPETATAAYGTQRTGMPFWVFSRVVSVCLLIEGFPCDNYNGALILTIQGPSLGPVTPLPLRHGTSLSNPHSCPPTCSNLFNLNLTVWEPPDLTSLTQPVYKFRHHC